MGCLNSPRFRNHYALQKRSKTIFCSFLKDRINNIGKNLVITSVFVRVIEARAVDVADVFKSFNINLSSHCLHTLVSFKLLSVFWFFFLQFQCLSNQLVASGTFAVSHFSKYQNLSYIRSTFKFNWNCQTIDFINHWTKLIEKLFWVFNLLIIHFLNTLIQILDFIIDF